MIEFLQMTTIFIFHRDLRIKDNKGINYCKQLGFPVIPIFIFLDIQITNKNKYKSDNAIQFMIQSLYDLQQQIGKIYFFKSNNYAKTVKSIIKMTKAQYVVFNEDYTPYAKKRTKSLQNELKNENCEIHTIQDYLLFDIGKLNKKDSSVYSVYSAFKNNAFKFKPDKPTTTLPQFITNSKLQKKSVKLSSITKYYNNDLIVEGGRSNALKQLQKYNANLYNKNRNLLSYNTSELSAFIKFGNLSIREVWHKINNKTFRSQLLWREFYYYIVNYNPQVLSLNSKNKSYNDKLSITWKYNTNWFDLWCNGETGFPVVDAGMRQLNQTGYMHNRARLITANFLTRLLHIDWRLGEQYYATKLTDYDPSVNNGNWQWIASTGVDTKPFKQRIFNPWLQSKKYDPNCKYIKEWIPELEDIPNSKIHNWHKYWDNYEVYLEPIVDYEEEKQISIQLYTK